MFLPRKQGRSVVCIAEEQKATWLKHIIMGKGGGRRGWDRVRSCRLPTTKDFGFQPTYDGSQ